MARHTRKEFAEMCGIRAGDIFNYVKRGNIVLDGELIDDRNDVNKRFIQKREMKVKDKVSEPKTQPESTTESDPEPKQNSYTQALRDKALLDIEHKQELIESKRLENRKKLGLVVPTDGVRSIIVMHTESIKVSYVEASDGLIVLFAQKGGLNADDISLMRKKFKDLVNKAVDDALNATSVEIDKMVREFSDKRGVGQHD